MRKKIIIALFIVFLFLRLFVDLPVVLLAADSMKFLNLANHFPYHTLSNNQLYLQHAPVYPYAIHFANLLIKEDYLAAIAINLVAACIMFFVLYRLFMLLTNNFGITFIVLLLYTLSVDLIIASHKVTRESFVVMLLISSIYFYVKGVKFNSKKSIIISSIFGGIVGITTDHVVFLFPSFALSYIFLNSRKINIKKLYFPNIKYAVIPVIITLAFYASWLGVRAYQYSAHEYYPAGLEGSPLRIKNFGLFELINPTFFDEYESKAGIQTPDVISHFKKYAFLVGYMFNIEPLSIPRGLNLTTMKFLLYPQHVIYMIFLYLPLAIIAIYGFIFIMIDFYKNKKIHNNINLYILSLFIIFMFPITQKVTDSRFIYTAYIFLFYVIAYSIIALLKRIDLFKKNAKILSIVIIALLLLLTPVWYHKNNYFVFLTKKYVFSEKTGDFINKNIKKTDAIMTQPGYTYKLIYMTGNRVIGMPPKSKDLLPFLEYYNISYVIFGRYYTFDKYHYNADSVELIKSSQDKFKLIATIKEDYTKYTNPKDPASSDEVYIYEVKK